MFSVKLQMESVEVFVSVVTLAAVSTEPIMLMVMSRLLYNRLHKFSFKGVLNSSGKQGTIYSK